MSPQLVAAPPLSRGFEADSRYVSAGEGKLKTMLRLILRSAVITVLALGLPLAVAYAQSSPTVEITPSGAAPGASVTVQGTSWPANASVVVRLRQSTSPTSPSAVVATATANASGSFSVKGTVPLTLFGAGARGNLTVVPGSYSILATNGPAMSATATYPVGAPAQGALLWGVVFFDVDGNGQFDSRDVPAVAGVTIQSVSQSAPVIHAITDGTGRYSVTVAPGTYRLSTQSQFQNATWAGTVSASAANGQAVRADIPLSHTAVTPTPPRLPATGGLPWSPVVLGIVGSVLLAVGVGIRLVGSTK